MVTARIPKEYYKSLEVYVKRDDILFEHLKYHDWHHLFAELLKAQGAVRFAKSLPETIGYTRDVEMPTNPES